MEEPHAAEAVLPDTAADTLEPNPLAQSAGRFQDDPFWDEMLDSIRRHRREMDAEWDVPE
jgi:hypothetical protein